MQIVPTQATPNQTMLVILNNQLTQIDVYQTDFGLFMDIYLNNVLIIGGVICQNLNRIIWSLYLGYQGDFAWIDNEGNDDPFYSGLGTRWSLAYLPPGDLLPNEG